MFLFLKNTCPISFMVFCVKHRILFIDFSVSVGFSLLCLVVVPFECVEGCWYCELGSFSVLWATTLLLSKDGGFLRTLLLVCSSRWEVHITDLNFVFSSETATLPYHIPHLACSVYHMTLKDLPAMVRLWWNSSEKRVFNIVDRFTSKYVSNVLSFQEISSVQTSTQLFSGMTVSIVLTFSRKQIPLIAYVITNCNHLIQNL